MVEALKFQQFLIRRAFDETRNSFVIKFTHRTDHHDESTSAVLVSQPKVVENKKRNFSTAIGSSGHNKIKELFTLLAMSGDDKTFHFSSALEFSSESGVCVLSPPLQAWEIKCKNCFRRGFVYQNLKASEMT